MSEFNCRRGHSLRAGEHECLICWSLGYPKEGAIIMKGYNLPDDTGPNDPTAPWNQEPEDPHNQGHDIYADDYEEEQERRQYESDSEDYPD